MQQNNFSSNCKLKQNNGLAILTLERYSCINKKFLVVSAFSNSLVVETCENMSEVKLLGAFQVATRNFVY